jgi:hypothetical protein
MHPHWLGSPQHVIAGALLALAVVVVGRRFVEQRWLLAILAIGVTATAELLVELFEYPVFYSGPIGARVYYDTIADLASTLVGAVIGTAVGIPALRRSSRR